MSAAYAYDGDPAGAHKVEDTSADVAKLKANIASVNIAADLDDTTLNKIAQRVVEEYKIDLDSLTAAGWIERNTRAMKLALQVREVKSYPWPNAANVKYPLVALAAIQFNARAYPAIVDGANVVKGKVLGEPNDQKTDRADRIGRHMSYQLLEEMDGWEEDTDRLLIMLPITGCAFRKTYFDPVRGYNCSHLVPPGPGIAGSPGGLVVNYWTKDLESCPRSTEICTYYPNEIEERMRSGKWLRVDLGTPPQAANDDLAPHTFLEQHRLWDLDGDGYLEPYIVTVHQELQKVVRIVARYDEDGITGNEKGEVVLIKPVRYYTKYPFIPSPDGAFYDIGFGHLLDAINETVNSTFNQLLDAGHLSNVQGGFIGSGVTMKAGSLRFSPGEWKRAEASGGDLKNAIVPLPVQAPSAVLFQLLGMLIEASKDITATKDILTGETQGSNQPVGTTLATIEQGLKVFTAIYKRIHRALKGELAQLYRLNRLYLNPKAYFEFQDVPQAVAQEDYAAKDVDVVPVSDPSVVTDMQRIHRAQYLMQFLHMGLDDQEIIRRALEAGGIQDLHALEPKGPPPPDPKMMVEQAKLQNDQMRIELDAKAHDLAERQFLLEQGRFALEEATARAQNTEAYATAFAEIEALGKVNEKNPDGSTSSATRPIPAEVPIVFDTLHRLADVELNVSPQGPQLQDPNGPSPDALRQGQPGAMAGPPADGGVPPVPAGPAIDPGQAMGVGPADGAGPPDQGAAPGGAGNP